MAKQSLKYRDEDRSLDFYLREIGETPLINAAEEVRQAANYTTSVNGGHGAMREVIELLLKNTNRWEAAIRKYAS